ncbi:hypothetical protein Tco_0977835 [Tanacetum coccineum]|uniref:Transposase MuDR plant domain-containing protein n=1 Tax=Tanacetum coccineum TaxID=301880 RepID=A0ABQ5EL82_9ASTR
MFDFNMTNDMPIMDEVVFKIHKNRYFEFDPLRYVNGSVSSVSAFTCDRDIFPTCLDWICSKIIENKWALFYCLPNKSLEQCLNLIYTDNDVHSFFADAESNEEDAALRCSSSSPFSTRIKRKGGKTTKEGLRKKAKGKQKLVDDEPVGRKSVKTSRKGKEIMYELLGPSPTKESRVVVSNYKKAIVNEKAKMVEVEDVGLVQDKVDVGNKEDVGTRRNMFSLLAPGNKHKQPVGSATKVQGSTVKISFVQESTSTETSMDDWSGSAKSFSNPIYAYFARTNELPENYCVFEINYDGVFNEYSLRCSLEEGLTIVEGDGDMNKLYDIAENVADELVLDDNWQYEGLAVDDVGGSSKHCDLVHENVVYKGHSLPNMDKERFSNNVVLDDVVTDTLAYTLPLVLKKKCRNKVNVTRKTRCLNNSKSMRLRKGCGKRVAIGGHGRGLGRFIGLNVDAVDDDPQVTKQVSLPARSSNTEVKDLE